MAELLTFFGVPDEAIVGRRQPGHRPADESLVLGGAALREQAQHDVAEAEPGGDDSQQAQSEAGRGANGKWKKDAQASHVQFISAASDGTVWLSSADPADKDRLFRRTGANRWQKDAKGKAIQGSAGAADNLDND